MSCISSYLGEFWRDHIMWLLRLFIYIRSLPFSTIFLNHQHLLRLNPKRHHLLPRMIIGEHEPSSFPLLFNHWNPYQVLFCLAKGEFESIHMRWVFVLHPLCSWILPWSVNPKVPYLFDHFDMNQELKLQ